MTFHPTLVEAKQHNKRGQTAFRWLLVFAACGYGDVAVQINGHCQRNWATAHLAILKVILIGY